jgi:hypothetical protein
MSANVNTDNTMYSLTSYNLPLTTLHSTLHVWNLRGLRRSEDNMHKCEEDLSVSGRAKNDSKLIMRVPLHTYNHTPPVLLRPGILHTIVLVLNKPGQQA